MDYKLDLSVFIFLSCAVKSDRMLATDTPLAFGKV